MTDNIFLRQLFDSLKKSDSYEFDTGIFQILRKEYSPEIARDYLVLKTSAMLLNSYRQSFIRISGACKVKQTELRALKKDALVDAQGWFAAQQEFYDKKRAFLATLEENGVRSQI